MASNKNSQNSNPSVTSAPAAPKVYVYGHKVLDNGSIVIIFKDRVNKNPLLAVRAERSGSLFAAKGVTLAEIQAEFPRGKHLVDASWGEAVENEKLQNVYYVEGLD